MGLNRLLLRLREFPDPALYASTWLRRRSTNPRDPASAVFCGEVGAADAPFGRQRHAAARS